MPGRAGDPGVTAKDNRLFINAVLWIAKTGVKYQDQVYEGDHKAIVPEDTFTRVGARSARP